MPLTIVRQDITKMKVDAVVNAANTSLQAGGGVCGAIFRAAGADRLQAACDKLAPIKTGDAVITAGFNLPAKYIIHTAGPVYRDGTRGEEKQLKAAYTNSLTLAVENGCESIAFPLISSGVLGYPKAEALKAATSAIRDFLSEHDVDVSLVVFDKAAFAVSEALLGKVRAFIDEHYVDEARARDAGLRRISDTGSWDFDAAATSRYIAPPFPAQEAVKAVAPHFPAAAKKAAKLDDLVKNLDEPFSQTLLRLIDAKGKTDVEIYKRANIDRKLFSKIRTSKGYMPSKKTALALAVALELTLTETGDLLERAGYTLSRSRKFDVIVEYFITNRQYNIFEINEVLFSYDQPLLGG